jgi:transposase
MVICFSLVANDFHRSQVRNSRWPFGFPYLSVPYGKYPDRLSNVKAKSGLNRAILDKGWHMMETFTKYKAYRAGKAVFKVSAPYTSQECAVCGHTTPATGHKPRIVFVPELRKY